MTSGTLLDRVRVARRRLEVDGPAALRSEGDFDRVAIPQSDGDTLRDLLVTNEARVVIEIGLAYGSSALAIAEALVAQHGTGATHLIIDPFQDQFHDAGWKAILAAGLADVCSLLRARSQLVLPRLLEEGFVADAAFVDGSHVFHNVFVDLFFLGELVRPGGLVVLDDCDLLSVGTAVRYFEAHSGWREEPAGGETRLRAYRLPDNPIEPPVESFELFGSDSAT